MAMLFALLALFSVIFHTGESNRRVPGKGRMPWHEIGAALREINYTGVVVMEPFVKTGGTIGSDIKVWRDLTEGAGPAKMDEDARNSLAFLTLRVGLNSHTQSQLCQEFSTHLGVALLYA